MKKTNIKIAILSILDFIFLFGPLATIMIINRNTYFYRQEGIKLSVGCIMGLVFVILLMKGKIKGLGAFWWCLIVTVMFYLIQTILIDATLLAGMATIGAFFDNAIFKPMLIKQRKIKELELSSDINAKALKRVVYSEEGNV